MKVRSAFGALCASLALTAGLVISAGTAHADTASCANAQAAVTADQQKLNVDQARLSNDPATIPDPANPGQVKTNPAVATDQAVVNADRGQLASDQSAVAIACGTTPTTTPVPTPWPHSGGDIVCTTATSCTQNGQPYTGSVSACTTFPCRLDANGQLDSDPAHHHFPGGGLNGNWLNGIGLGGLTVLNGNTIVLGSQQVDVCAVPNWQSFYNRYNPYFGSLRAQLNQLRYEQLLAQAGCANNSGVTGLTLINGQWINLSQYGVPGGSSVSVCSYPSYNAFDQFGVNRFGPNFNPFVQHYGGYLAGSGWDQLRLRANCQPTVVTNNTTVEQAPATVAPAATPEAAAPQTAQSPAQVRHVPSGSVDTGDGSAPDVN